MRLFYGVSVLSLVAGLTVPGSVYAAETQQAGTAAQTGP